MQPYLLLHHAAPDCLAGARVEMLISGISELRTHAFSALVAAPPKQLIKPREVVPRILNLLKDSGCRGVEYSMGSIMVHQSFRGYSHLN